MIETARAKQAWADYLALGPERSLDKLIRDYHIRTTSIPTRQLSRLKRWSTDWGWQGRLGAIADAEAQATIEREAAYRRAILDEGFGLSHERVKVLKEMAGLLADELRDPKRRWVQDSKLLGQTIVGIERFNAAEVEQFRGVLDDIAKEKSERKEVKVLQGDKDAPIIVRTIEVLIEPEPGPAPDPDGSAEEA